MTLRTEIRVLQGDIFTTGEVFHKLREIIGMPESHPCRITDNRIDSIPGSFRSALSVGGHGCLSYEEVNDSMGADEPISWAMSISLDTSYLANGGAATIHNAIIAEFAAAFPEICWAAHNEFEDTWHLNNLPYT